MNCVLNLSACDCPLSFNIPKLHGHLRRNDCNEKPLHESFFELTNFFKVVCRCSRYVQPLIRNQRGKYN